MKESVLFGAISLPFWALTSKLLMICLLQSYSFSVTRNNLSVPRHIYYLMPPCFSLFCLQHPSPACSPDELIFNFQVSAPSSYESTLCSTGGLRCSQSIWYDPLVHHPTHWAAAASASQETTNSKWAVHRPWSPVLPSWKIVLINH